MDDEFYFPEPIIQHIQYFLTSKEAAQTTLLSSSWGSAWLTRPNIDFDQFDLPQSLWKDAKPLLEFAEKTITRYETWNLKIESFRLCVNTLFGSYNDRIEKLVVRALKFGATRLSFDFMSKNIVLPNDVFGSENLVALTVKQCKFGLGLNQKVGCSRLQSLSLESIQIESLDMFFRILSSFPLIEKLSLSYIFHFGNQGTVGGGYVVGDGLANLPRLRSLVLNCVFFDTLFLCDLLPKFPSLKDVTLSHLLYQADTRYNDKILISSRSLERLDITLNHSYFLSKYGVSETSPDQMFTFDVPSIRKFTFNFEGNHVPSMSFISTSRGWESHVSISHHECPTSSLLCDLSKLITELSTSRMSLYLHLYSKTIINYNVGDIQVLPTHKIENLTVNVEGIPPLNCDAILDALFRMCRPKLITQFKTPGLFSNVAYPSTVKFTTQTREEASHKQIFVDEATVSKKGKGKEKM